MDWLIERFRSSQGHIAFIHGGREVTYGEVLVTIAAFRTRIDAVGIQKK